MNYMNGRPRIGPASFYREALGIAIPVMLQALITSLVSLVDNFMVAGLGDVKMAAVNVANQLNFVFFVLVNIACMAGGIYLSQHRGAGDAEGMRQSLRFKVLIASAVAVAYTALCLVSAEQLIGLMLIGNAERAPIIEEGARYLRWVSPSFIPLALAGALGSSFRDIGRTGIPLAVSSAAALVNTILNWILIYGNFGAPRLEVAGAAIATDIARIAEALSFLIIILVQKPSFSFPPRLLFKLDRGLFGEILKRSWMMFFSEIGWVVSETVITAIYNGRGGSETVAGMAAGWTIANIFFMVFGAVVTATSVIVGSTLGAGRLEEARAKARWITYGSVMFGTAVGAAAAASTFLIPIVFGNLSGDARTITRGIVLVIASYIPLWTLLNAQFAISRAGGDTLMGLWVDVGVTYTLFIPAAFILAWWTSMGPVALFALAKLSDIPKAAVAFWWLAKGRWVKNLAAKT